MNHIHCLFTNKNEEDIQHLLQKMNLSNYTILIQLDMENYSFEYLHTSSNKEYEFFYYNGLIGCYQPNRFLLKLINIFI